MAQVMSAQASCWMENWAPDLYRAEIRGRHAGHAESGLACPACPTCQFEALAEVVVEPNTLPQRLIILLERLLLFLFILRER